MLSLERQNELREEYRKINPGWRPATEVYADLVRAHLPPDAKVLDLGCGRGGLVEQLEHPLAQIAGVDPDELSLREHRLALPRAAAMSDGLPFAADSFDVVFASWLLEHLERPLSTFSQISRVLKPGGVFIFITPNTRHPLSALNRGLGQFSQLQGRLVKRFYGRAEGDAFPTFYRANSETAMGSLCRECNLEVSELQLIPDPTYLAFNQAFFKFMIWFDDKLAGKRQLHMVGCLLANPPNSE
ncbi:MAG: methyltransferase domain-containing protein [Aquificales bacterium]|nr:methyltransferase domain-containing protein [Aquificales bacterium]